LVGEAPGQDEELMREPFVGASGRLLKALCSSANILPSACLIANVCQFRPPGNDISAFDWNGQQIQQGLLALKADISSFDPHVVLLLGATPLRAAGASFTVSEYRGSIFNCADTDSPFYGKKCLSTYHPAAVLRNYEWAPLLAFDLQRARHQSTFPDLRLPQRTLLTNLSADEIIYRLSSIRPGELVSIDIEGGIPPNYGGVTCVGVSTSADSGFIVNHNDFPDSERVRIVKALVRLLGDSAIPKVLQNSLYDNFVLSWLWRAPIRNVVHDTMLSGWEIYPELPKGLGTQASIWTEEPYYKFERKIQDQETHYKYCIKDACVTYEIAERHREHLNQNPEAARHFAFNVQLLPALLYMELKGIRYDREKAISRKEEIQVKQRELQARIDSYAGVSLNVNSPKQMCETLYRKLGFEPQYQKEHGRKTTKLTADVEALLNLARCYNESIIFDILRWRALDGQRKQLEISSDADGRVRCSYNIVGTETGRLNSSESPTGTGTNLQTITKSNRDLYGPDPGYYFFQCDLSGADGWTVAAHCKRLGDSTMMDDYLYGLKPAKIIAIAKLLGPQIFRADRAELARLCKETPIPAWLYDACKAVQHGSNYGMGKNTMSTNILKQGWKKSGEVTYVSPRDCEELQRLYFARYIGIKQWHAWVQNELTTKKALTCASGHTRQFFGRPNDMETFKSALSHEPQANTTYATNMAVHRLWHDEQNWNSQGLIIQPLHQVHDAVCGQFPIELADWARAKVKSYFDNPLTIAGYEITIPYEGLYGSNWKELEHEL
jgi:uracil-DNA glycosylase family 4